MNISTVVDFITDKLNGVEIPVNLLPVQFLKCIATARPGLSAYKTTAQIIANNKILGIATGPNPDGSANLINQYTYNVVKCIFDSIKNDAMVQMVTPKNSLVIKATGANAGGPMECIGTNLTDGGGVGIIQ
jgi:hypothetical protein